MRFEGLEETWDLASIFSGGSDSEALASYIKEIGEGIETLGAEIAELEVPTSVNEAGLLKSVIDRMQDVASQIEEVNSFISCLTAQDAGDKKAVRLGATLSELVATFGSRLTLLDEKLTRIDDDVWQALLSDPFQGIAFQLDERRRHASEKMSPEQEALAGDLSVDGYEGWSGLYDTVVGNLEVEVEEDGENNKLSVSQVENKLSDPNRDVRQNMFEKYTKTWEGATDYCADALNHLSGFRLNVYKHRGWDSFLKEPLAINRMSQQTLDTMWSVIDKYKEAYVKYFNRKAKLLGVDQLAWYDVEAPIAESQEKISYGAAAQFIVAQFRRFSPKMADFAEMAFERRWIEAEDRSNKRPGGFCTSFPRSGESRVFLTFSGTKDNLGTVAHELGHAYHQYVMEDMPYLSQQYAMNVAETASTFAEAVVSDAALEQASSKEERLALLDEKVQRGVVFFTNLRARFLFETRFYEERKQGIVSVERLNELMTQAQKDAFGDALSEYHPTFWASKLHFYITDVPFYNFPYTFGYLFSSGIYAKAREEGSGFEDAYVALLRDTARMTTEELAAKHLDVDLRKPDFWEKAVGMTVDDIDEFLRETNK